MHFALAWYWVPVWTFIGVVCGFCVAALCATAKIADLESEIASLERERNAERILNFDREC